MTSEGRETRLLLLTLQPKTLADAERMDRGLQHLLSEDPTLTVEADRQVGTATIGAMGELQLEIVVDRLKREFGVEADLSRPRVAYRDILTPDGSVRLEPVMSVEVIVPPEDAAGVSRDLDARRGVIVSHEDRNGRPVVAALVPLAELFGYNVDLRQRTLGRGTFTQVFDSYQPVPAGPDGDRAALVPSPTLPVTRPRVGGMALPEPDD